MSIRDVPRETLDLLIKYDKELHGGQSVVDRELHGNHCYADRVLNQEELREIIGAAGHRELYLYPVRTSFGPGYCVAGISGGWPDIAGELRPVLTMLERQIPPESTAHVKMIAELPSTLEVVSIAAENERQRKERNRASMAFFLISCGGYPFSDE